MNSYLHVQPYMNDDMVLPHTWHKQYLFVILLSRFVICARRIPQYLLNHWLGTTFHLITCMQRLLLYIKVVWMLNTWFNDVNIGSITQMLIFVLHFSDICWNLPSFSKMCPFLFAWMTNIGYDFPIAAVDRGREVIVSLKETFCVGDHDFSKFSLIPSVILLIDIANSMEESWYTGEVHIGIKDAVFEPSSAVQSYPTV